jgi:glutathione peroxidase
VGVTLYDIPLRTLDGEPTTLAPYRGQVLLIVNVASRCGLTPQYEGLEQLHRELSPRGFSVLGFPCNQFAFQEPGSAEEIKTFCSMTYGVTFPIFEKVKVNGFGTHPLYRRLKRAQPTFLWWGPIKWNFTKFLVGRDGRVEKRYAPKVLPEWMRERIVGMLEGRSEDRAEGAKSE